MMRTSPAKKPREGPESGIWYEVATLTAPGKIKRHLKRFKGGIFGSPGGGFSGFEGGAGNA
jgi:hypothetical protein